MREKVGKSRNTVFFQWFVAPEGRKVGSLKRRVRSQLARWVMKNCTPLWRGAHFEVKMLKAPQLRTAFGSWDVEKVHSVVARSTFRSENVQSTPLSDHFWKLRCRKSARRCGAKHISKWNAQNTPASDYFWQLRCWKSARRCGTKHISKSKCTKHTMFGPLFGGLDVEKVHAVVARRTFRSTNVQNTRGSDHFWRFRCRFASIHYTTGHYTTLHYNYTTTQLHNYTATQLHNYTPLHSTTLNYTTLHYTKLHYTTLHYTTLHWTTLHYTTLHDLPLHFATLHYTTLHSTTLQLHNYTPLH